MHGSAKTAAFAVALVVLLLLTTGFSSAEGTHRPDGCSTLYSVQDFKAFSAKTWSSAHWRTEPEDTTIATAEHERLCAAGRTTARTKMRAAWIADKQQFYEKRSRELFRLRVTPFHYGGHWWAVPYPIALCESGGDYHIGFAGAYGLLEATWAVYGDGSTGVAGDASPRSQDIAAHKLYRVAGDSAWAPYESGCAYR